MITDSCLVVLNVRQSCTGLDQTGTEPLTIPNSNLTLLRAAYLNGLVVEETGCREKCGDGCLGSGHFFYKSLG